MGGIISHTHFVYDAVLLTKCTRRSKKMERELDGTLDMPVMYVRLSLLGNRKSVRELCDQLWHAQVFVTSQFQYVY